jgi:large subunit ribosomal protein L2
VYPNEFSEGNVIDIIHAPGRRSPVAVVDMNGKKQLFIASEGMYVGQTLTNNKIDTGGVVELSKIPDGTKIYDVEITPGDGGKICRSSGTFATVISHDDKRCVILLPSKKKKVLSGTCRASIGVVSASGRKEKPFMKAGKKHHVMKAFGRLYPHTSGVSMNAVDHPFGGKTRPGKPKTVSRHMPPGKKVGSISPRRVGKKTGKTIVRE